MCYVFLHLRTVGKDVNSITEVYESCVFWWWIISVALITAFYVGNSLFHFKKLAAWKGI